MIVAAAESGDDLRQHSERRPVEAYLPKRRAHQRTDEHDILAALLGSETHEAAELADDTPVMWIARDQRRVGDAAQGEQHDGTSAAPHGIGDGKRQTAACADDRE